MRDHDYVVLNTPAKTVSAPHDWIVAQAKGKRVLSVGAAGNAHDYRDGDREHWLHARLSAVSTRLVGLDLDPEGVDIVSGLGFDMVLGNCETVALDEGFDVIVMSDVIEHVDNPVVALENMLKHLNANGQVVITTPNATGFGNMLTVFLRRAPKVYWDHVAVYVPEHLQAICDRHGWALGDTAFFTLKDTRTFGVRMKSAVLGLLGGLFPRAHNAFLCTISPSGASDQKS